ncbi:hypothetical protein AAC387_Pa05g3398 [Persea americana]
MNDALEKKFHEERFSDVKLVSRTLQQVESLILELEEANKKLALVKRELGEANSYLRVAELKLQFANERATRRDSDMNDLNNSLCISEERANDAIALVELRSDEIIRLTRIVGGLQINNKILEKEKFMLTGELKESQVAMDVVCREKEDVFKELEDTKLQSQIKEKELQEELEVALFEKKIFFEHLRFKLQSQVTNKSQEKELAPRKKKSTKRAERATCIKLIVALIFAFITVKWL